MWFFFSSLVSELLSIGRTMEEFQMPLLCARLVWLVKICGVVFKIYSHSTQWSKFNQYGLDLYVLLMHSATVWITLSSPEDKWISILPDSVRLWYSFVCINMIIKQDTFTGPKPEPTEDNFWLSIDLIAWEPYTLRWWIIKQRIQPNRVLKKANT